MAAILKNEHWQRCGAKEECARHSSHDAAGDGAGGDDDGDDAGSDAGGDGCLAACLPACLPACMTGCLPVLSCRVVSYRIVSCRVVDLDKCCESIFRAWQNSRIVFSTQNKLKGSGHP